MFSWALCVNTVWFVGICCFIGSVVPCEIILMAFVALQPAIFNSKLTIFLH